MPKHPVQMRAGELSPGLMTGQLRGPRITDKSLMRDYERTLALHARLPCVLWDTKTINADSRTVEKPIPSENSEALL